MTARPKPKITLIVPPVDYKYCAIVTTSTLMSTVRKFPSLGLGYIAAVLEKHGYPIQYVDMFASNVTLGKLRAFLAKEPPRYVGITTDVATINTSRDVARIVKKINSKCTVIVGGFNIGLYPEEILDFPYFDIGVIGEGELTIVDLMEKLEAGIDLGTVPGIAYKQDGKIHRTGTREIIRDLDALPYPARHLMPTKNYISSISKLGYLTTMLASRGCPFNCLYCIKDHNFRMRTPANVVDEIEHIVKELGIHEIYFCDPTFTVNQQRVIEICKEIIKRRLDVVWEAATRVDSVSPELLRWMKRAGCARIQYGIESGDPRVLRLLRKRITISQIKDAFRWAKQNDLDILASFMIGCPGDDLASIERTVDFAIKLDPQYIVFTIATIGPGTDMHDLAVKQGIVDENQWRRYMRGENKEMPNPIFTSKEYDRKKLEVLLKRAYRRFYLRPSFIVKRLLKTRSIFELKNNVLGLKIVLLEILSHS